MYNNIIFDLYGTLVDISTNEESPALWRNMAKIYETFGASYTGPELRKTYSRLCGEEEKKFSYPDPEILLDRVFENLYVEKGVLPDESLVWYTGNTFRSLSRSRLKTFDGIHELLADLKRAGKRVFLLSNAQRIFTWQELSICKLIPYFDGLFISSDHGRKKPDPEYMKLLLSTYQLNPKECIMVGNEVRSDIKIANACNMDSLYIRTSDFEPICGNIDATCEILDGDIKKMAAFLLK